MMRLVFIFMYLSCASVFAETGLTVASKKFTENVILAEIAAQLLSGEQVKTKHRQELGGTRILWNALLAGEIDIYPEYTGTLRQEIFAGESLPDDQALAERLKQHDILMTKPLGFNNTYVLGMQKDKATKLKINKISDLQSLPQLTLGFSNEFMSRADGWLALQRHYQLPQTNVIGLDHDLAYRGLANEDIDIIDLYSTDAEIDYYGIHRLEDDRNFFTEYKAVYLYREQAQHGYPVLINKLKRLEGLFDEQTMSTLNKQVKIEGQDSAVVVAGFLQARLQVSPEYSTSTWLSRLYKHTLNHLYLVLVSLSCAIIIAIPLGIIAAKQARLGQLVLASTSVVQTIPALALFVFLIPFLGIGTIPAIVALFLYSLLPIIRNTVSGLRDIPTALTESATAMGLPAGERLKRIELPLALRSIMSGIKTAAVINVGLATLGALIGAGGYGQPILTGIRLDNVGLILEGAIPAAVLALLVQGMFDLIEKKLLPEY